MNPRDLLIHYVVYSEEDGTTITICGAGSDHLKHLKADATKLWDIYAASYEEAMSIHYLRLGFEPYLPEGEPQLCPNQCGSNFYPLGSGACPICGPM